MVLNMPTMLISKIIIIRDTISHYILSKYEDSIYGMKVMMMAHELIVATGYCLPRHNITSQIFRDFFQALSRKFSSGSAYKRKHTLWESHLLIIKGKKYQIDRSRATDSPRN